MLLLYEGLREELRVIDDDRDTVRDTLADNDPTKALLRETVVVAVIVS